MAIITFQPSLPSLSSFIPDNVAVFDQDYNQVFSEAEVIRMFVREDSEVMEHPLETGAVIADHQIFEPIELEYVVILPTTLYRNIYQQIKQLFLSSTLLYVQTKTTVYSNMLLRSIPHQETTDMYNAVPMDLRFKQAAFAPSPQSAVVPRDPTNSSTVSRGTQQGSTVPEDLEQFMGPSALFGFFGGFF